MSILIDYKKDFSKLKPEILSLESFLEQIKTDKSLYASPFERMLTAIGKPKLLDTSNNASLARIFGSRIIKQYKVFEDFHGMEEVIERLVAFFKHASQGLEESRQILYLLGPVGSAKSSLAEKLKKLIETQPIYILADEKGEYSPVFEHPFGLFTVKDSATLNIAKRYLECIPSPWAMKRIDLYDGDLSKFKVVKIYPDQLKQIAISKTEPGDENNQDISSLVGKLDIRKLEFYSQNDPDAYNYSGGLCLSNQGLFEFVEMFKAPIKVLHPLLTATQEKNYKGSEAIGPIPFDGIIIAHSNEAEWNTFKKNRNNEAFLDRIYIVDVPYCLRVDEEIKIYKKLLNTSDLIDAPCAPETLKTLAEFAILSRLDIIENHHLESKMKVYNGENIKEKDPKSKSYQEYKDLASKKEGFTGISTRLAYKILAQVFNFDSFEIAADPVHMLYVLEKTVLREDFGEELEELYLKFLKNYLAPKFAKLVGKDIQTAYLDSYSEYGQALFDKYLLFADHWMQDNDYRDPDTGQLFDRASLNSELEKIEKPAEIANPKDFRHEVVNFALRYQARNDGNNPKWSSYEKLKKVIESTMFSKTKDLLPVISFSVHKNNDESKKHKAFIDRMQELGYTKRQIKRVVEWHMRFTKTN